VRSQQRPGEGRGEGRRKGKMHGIQVCQGGRRKADGIIKSALEEDTGPEMGMNHADMLQFSETQQPASQQHRLC
jgi:hypothetical protein